MTHADGGSGRIAAVRLGLERVGAAAALFGLSSNLRYLTGFSDEPGERLLLLVVPREAAATCLVPALYADQVAAHSPAAELEVWADGEDPQERLAEIAGRIQDVSGPILVDDSLWAAFTLQAQAAFVGRPFGLASCVMTPLRERKDAAELAAMRRAGEIADAAFTAVTAAPISGRAEIEVAGRLEAAMLAAGADGIAFETLIASGPNSALPHHRAGTRTIRAGDFVILDYGCRVDGYRSDISRTVVCGDPSREGREAHEAVLQAHWAARERVTAGIEAQAVDAAARGVLTSAGYAAQFVHRTGHGIGLDVHEPPYIVNGNDHRLEEGMTFSIEPGVYFRGRFGVRIEDVVVVTRKGAEAMTHAPQELVRVS